MSMQKGMSWSSRGTPALAPLCRNAPHRRGGAAPSRTRTRHPKGNRRRAAPKAPLPHGFQTRATVGGHALDGAAATVAACQHALHTHVRYGTTARASRLTQISLTGRPLPASGYVQTRRGRCLGLGRPGGGGFCSRAWLAVRSFACGVAVGCANAAASVLPRSGVAPAGGRYLSARPPPPLMLTAAASSHSYPSRPPVPAQRFRTVVIGSIACDLSLLLRC